MKHNATLLFLIAAVFFHTNAKAYSQGITLKVSDASLDKVFTLIQKQTKFVFVYSAKQLAGTKRVSVDVKDEKLEKVLQMILEGQPLRYEVDKEYVIIKVKMPALVDNLAGKPGEIVGRVTNEKGEPVAGATVTVKNSNINAATDHDGYFILKGVDTQGELVITSIGYEPKIVKLTGDKKIIVKMTVSAQTIKEVVVRGNTGYQTIDKNHPGSFNVINNELVNRKVSPDILSRIENLAPGISFNNPGDGLLIRGRNSIYSNVSPLIVVDDFPYDGKIDNINPNDVENITILKDAAASAQWGARAGNGVIVITTKKGKSGKPIVDLNSNFTFQARPKLSKMPIISSSDEIELEKWLFEKGFYDGNISNNISYPVLSPVQELLLKKRNGELNEDEANKEIEKLKSISVFKDLEDHFYQPSISQQYSLNVSGNTPRSNYYMSVGIDNQRPSLVGQSSNRISIRSQNSFKLTDFLVIDGGITFTQATSENGSNPGVNINSGGGTGLYPYADLVDDQGSALYIVKDFRESYKDTAGDGKLLDWKYRPFDEIRLSKQQTKLRDFLLNLSLKYKLNNFIAFELKYRYENSVSSGQTEQQQASYIVRDLINKFYQPNAKNKYPIPLGGVLDVGEQSFDSHQGRAQISLDKAWNKLQEIHVITGFEIKSLKSLSNFNRIYGYHREGSIVNSSIDYVTMFPLFYRPSVQATVPTSQGVSETVDRFFSYYVNASYSLLGKFTVSSSIRRDEANLFGANTNQKGTPLWSFGASYELSNEKFYKFIFIPLLKLRASYGYNGNFSRATSGITTIQQSTVLNYQGLPFARIVNPPNESLRWEQDRVLNLGLDFKVKGDRIWGTLEFYFKHNKDLMAQSPIDPTSGLTPLNGGRSFFFGNVASIKGRGIDLELSSLNLNGKFKWNTTFIFSKAQTKVSDYLIPASKNSRDYVLSESNILPLIGKPVYTFFAYAWGGLDPNTGAPLGYLGKSKSNDYNSIFQKTTIDSLVYKGAAQAPIFGSLRNSFTWKSFSVSVIFSYRLKYFVRRPVLSYSALFSSWTGSNEFSKRWKQSGDEMNTNVPSLVYTTDPNFNNRDLFYSRSEIPIVPGDNIRFDDISLSYVLTKKMKKVPFEQIRFYSYISNMGIYLWKVNEYGLDPDNTNGRINRTRMSIGINVTF